MPDFDVFEAIREIGDGGLDDMPEPPQTSEEAMRFAVDMVPAKKREAWVPRWIHHGEKDYS